MMRYFEAVCGTVVNIEKVNWFSMDKEEHYGKIFDVPNAHLSSAKFQLIEFVDRVSLSKTEMVSLKEPEWKELFQIAVTILIEIDENFISSEDLHTKTYDVWEEHYLAKNKRT